MRKRTVVPLCAATLIVVSAGDTVTKVFIGRMITRFGVSVDVGRGTSMAKGDAVASGSSSRGAWEGRAIASSPVLF